MTIQMHMSGAEEWMKPPDELVNFMVSACKYGEQQMSYFYPFITRPLKTGHRLLIASTLYTFQEESCSPRWQKRNVIKHLISDIHGLAEVSKLAIMYPATFKHIHHLL
jgi:hypothetical protein